MKTGIRHYGLIRYLVVLYVIFAVLNSLEFLTYTWLFLKQNDFIVQVDFWLMRTIRTEGLVHKLLNLLTLVFSFIWVISVHNKLTGYTRVKLFKNWWYVVSIFLPLIGLVFHFLMMRKLILRLGDWLHTDSSRVIQLLIGQIIVAMLNAILGWSFLFWFLFHPYYGFAMKQMLRISSIVESLLLLIISIIGIFFLKALKKMTDRLQAIDTDSLHESELIDR